MDEIKGKLAGLPPWAKWGLIAVAVAGVAYLVYKLYQSYSASGSANTGLANLAAGAPLSVSTGGGTGATATDYSAQFGALSAQEQQLGTQVSQLSTDVGSLTSQIAAIGTPSTVDMNPAQPVPNTVAQEPSGSVAQEPANRSAIVGSYNNKPTVVTSSAINFNGVSIPRANAGPFPATVGGLVLGSGPAAMAESQALALAALTSGPGR